MPGQEKNRCVLGACDPPKDKNHQRYSDDAGEHHSNTLCESGHTDSFTGKRGGKENVASAPPNSALSLDEPTGTSVPEYDGEIVWMNRDGGCLRLPEVKEFSVVYRILALVHSENFHAGNS